MVKDKHEIYITTQAFKLVQKERIKALSKGRLRPKTSDIASELIIKACQRKQKTAASTATATVTPTTSSEKKNEF